MSEPYQLCFLVLHNVTTRVQRDLFCPVESPHKTLGDLQVKEILMQTITMASFNIFHFLSMSTMAVDHVTRWWGY